MLLGLVRSGLQVRVEHDRADPDDHERADRRADHPGREPYPSPSHERCHARRHGCFSDCSVGSAERPRHEADRHEEHDDAGIRVQEERSEPDEDEAACEPEERAPRVEEAAHALLDQLVVGAAVPGVTTGYVHVDSIRDPYSEILGDARLSADRFDEEVHGYYWAVLLTDGHLRRLGGAARVLAQAPCERVERLALDDGEGVLCVVTENPLALDPERVVAWRGFLLPVLRAGYPIGYEQIGQRGAPLRRPLHLFEGPPVPDGVRSVVVLGVMDPGAPPLPIHWDARVQDPERPTCWLYVTSEFERVEHAALVNATLNAWWMAGAHGKLAGVEGQLGDRTAATWDTDDGGAEALVWQFEPGTCDPTAAIEKLVAALREMAVVVGHVFRRVVVA